MTSNADRHTEAVERPETARTRQPGARSMKQFALPSVSLDSRIRASLGLLLFSYYVLTMSGHQYSIDGIIMFQSARTMLVHQSLFFDPPLRWGYNEPTTSKYGIGQTLAYLPVLVPVRIAKPGIFVLDHDRAQPYDQRLIFNELYRYASLVNAGVVALTAIATYNLAREAGLRRRPAVAAALICGAASPLAVYARLDFSQPLVGLTLTTAAWLALRARRTNSRAVLVAAGLALGYGILTRFTTILTDVPGIFLLYWLSARRGSSPAAIQPRAAWLLMAGPIVACIALYLGINYIKFGSPLEFGQSHAFSLADAHIALVGLLASPGRGLLLYFPLAWLLVIAWCKAPLEYRPITLATVAIVGSLLVVHAVWPAWWGGATWGPRFLIPAISLMTICTVSWFAHSAQKRAARTVLVGLVVLSVLASLNGILFDFLRFYGQYWAQHGYQGVAAAQQEQFLLAASPLFAGWQFRPDAAAFDLYWIWRIADGSTNAIFAVSALLALIAAAIVSLMLALRTPSQQDCAAKFAGGSGAALPDLRR